MKAKIGADTLLLLSYAEQSGAHHCADRFIPSQSIALDRCRTHGELL